MAKARAARAGTHPLMVPTRVKKPKPVLPQDPAAAYRQGYNDALACLKGRVDLAARKAQKSVQAAKSDDLVGLVHAWALGFSVSEHLDELVWEVEFFSEYHSDRFLGPIKKMLPKALLARVEAAKPSKP